MAGMSVKILRELAARRGADLSAWPGEERDAARELLAGSAAAREALAGIAALDAALAEMSDVGSSPGPAPSAALLERMIGDAAAVSVERQAVLASIQAPASPRMRASPLSRAQTIADFMVDAIRAVGLRPALAMGVCAVLGLMLGMAAPDDWILLPSANADAVYAAYGGGDLDGENLEFGVGFDALL